MAIAYIGIGSNLGERKKNIAKALELIKESSYTNIVKKSSLIETEPECDKDMPDFLNGVIKIDTFLSPQKLFSFLKDIEIKLGRLDKGNNQPRTIDLDILLFDDKEIKTDNLQIPHPRMFKRYFVLKPLLEIEPDILNNSVLLDKQKDEIDKLLNDNNGDGSL